MTATPAPPQSYVTIPSVNHQMAFEPPMSWKEATKAEIDKNSEVMRLQALESMHQKLKEKPVTEAGRADLELEYKKFVNSIRATAQSQFNALLQQERETLQWSTEGGISEDFLQEQRSILATIQQKKDPEDGMSPTVEVDPSPVAESQPPARSPSTIQTVTNGSSSRPTPPPVLSAFDRVRIPSLRQTTEASRPSNISLNRDSEPSAHVLPPPSRPSLSRHPTDTSSHMPPPLATSPHSAQSESKPSSSYGSLPQSNGWPSQTVRSVTTPSSIERPPSSSFTLSAQEAEKREPPISSSPGDHIPSPRRSSVGPGSEHSTWRPSSSDRDQPSRRPSVREKETSAPSSSPKPRAEIWKPAVGREESGPSVTTKVQATPRRSSTASARSVGSAGGYKSPTAGVSVQNPSHLEDERIPEDIFESSIGELPLQVRSDARYKKDSELSYDTFGVRQESASSNVARSLSLNRQNHTSLEDVERNPDTRDQRYSSPHPQQSPTEPLHRSRTVSREDYRRSRGENDRYAGPYAWNGESLRSPDGRMSYNAQQSSPVYDPTQPSPPRGAFPGPSRFPENSRFDSMRGRGRTRKSNVFSHESQNQELSRTGHFAGLGGEYAQDPAGSSRPNSQLEVAFHDERDDYSPAYHYQDDYNSGTRPIAVPGTSTRPNAYPSWPENASISPEVMYHERDGPWPTAYDPRLRSAGSKQSLRRPYAPYQPGGRSLEDEQEYGDYHGTGDQYFSRFRGREEEARTKEEVLRKQTEEFNQRAAQLKQREEDLLRRELEAKLHEEIRQKEENLMRQEQEIRRREEELAKKEKESNERAAKEAEEERQRVLEQERQAQAQAQREAEAKASKSNSKSQPYPPAPLRKPRLASHEISKRHLHRAPADLTSEEESSTLGSDDLQDEAETTEEDGGDAEVDVRDDDDGSSSLDSLENDGEGEIRRHVSYPRSQKIRGQFADDSRYSRSGLPIDRRSKDGSSQRSKRGPTPLSRAEQRRREAEEKRVKEAEQQRLRQEEEERLQKEKEQKERQQKEEEERQRMAAQAQRIVELEAEKALLEEQRKEAEERRLREEKERKQKEAEQRRQKKEERRLQKEAEERRLQELLEDKARLEKEAEERRLAEVKRLEEERLQKEAEEQKLKEEKEAEEKRRREEEEEQRKKEAEEKRILQEKARREREEATRRRREEEAELRRKKKEEARRRKEEEERAQKEEKERVQKEEEERVQKEEEERIQKEEEERVQKEEEERVQKEEEARLQREDEAERLRQEKEAAKKLRQEEEEAKKAAKAAKKQAKRQRKLMEAQLEVKETVEPEETTLVEEEPPISAVEAAPSEPVEAVKEEAVDVEDASPAEDDEARIQLELERTEAEKREQAAIVRAQRKAAEEEQQRLREERFRKQQQEYSDRLASEERDKARRQQQEEAERIRREEERVRREEERARKQREERRRREAEEERLRQEASDRLLAEQLQKEADEPPRFSSSQRPHRSGSTTSNNTSWSDRTNPSNSSWGSSAGTSWASSGPTRKPSTSFNSSTTNSIPFSEAEWQRRQAEQLRKQQEQFKREQERLHREQQMNSSRILTMDEVHRIIEKDVAQRSTLRSLDVIHWQDIPWPMLKKPSSPEEITQVAIAGYVFNPHHPEKSRSERDRVKDLIKHWHPDRFETKVLPRVPDDEKEEVKLGAGIVVRTLNELMTSAK